MHFGYARVSSDHQDLSLQLDAFARAGIERVYYEKRSGVAHRPQLEKALHDLVRGDVLIVWKLDRMARSLADLLGIIERLKYRGASFRSLTEPLDTTTPIGEFIIQVLGSVAQLERAMIRERAIAGQVAAYQRGIRWGGLRKLLTPEDEREICRLRATGWFTIPLLAEVFGVSASTICRALGTVKRKPRVPVLGHYLKEGPHHR